MDKVPQIGNRQNSMTYEETATFMTGLASELNLYVVTTWVYVYFYIMSPRLTYRPDGAPCNMDVAVRMDPKQMTVYTNAVIDQGKNGIETRDSVVLSYSKVTKEMLSNAVTSLMEQVDTLSQEMETGKIRKSAADLEELL